MLHRPDDGLASLAAGSFASAAITGSGELYLWGTVLSEDASTALLKQSGEHALLATWNLTLVGLLPRGWCTAQPQLLPEDAASSQLLPAADAAQHTHTLPPPHLFLATERDRLGHWAHSITADPASASSVMPLA